MFILCGFAIALAAAWFSRTLWLPSPVVIAPRVLAAGPGTLLPSIAAAMEQARAGDTVDVMAGEYREQVRLKSGVNLRSHVPRDASLRAAPMSNGPAVIAEGVKGARISGFRILADQTIPLAVGIRLVDSEVEIEDMEVDRAGVGIEIHGGIATLVGNAVHDCAGEGVLILGAGTPWLSHNTIQRNKGAGIAARDGAKPGLMGNVIEKNSLELPADTDMALIRERNFLLDAAVPRTGPRPRPRPTSSGATLPGTTLPGTTPPGTTSSRAPSAGEKK
jgi:hypothetical protein